MIFLQVNTMSADCMSELSRKPNTDYTISINDDEKLFIADKLNSNLFIENIKNTRDRSPGTCHNNADTINETVDISRMNADKRNESNHLNQQLDASSKRQKTVCYDFKKGICRRRFCRVSK